MKTLNQIINFLNHPVQLINVQLTNLQTDSRKVSNGSIFIAFKGISIDGRDYIDQAISQGVSAILVEKSDQYSAYDDYVKNNIPIYFVRDIKKKLGLLVSYFYEYPSNNVHIIGITGTNGKTSCCWLVAQLMQLINIQCAIMGTLGYGIPPGIKSSINTTSDIVTLNQYLYELNEKGIKNLAMEVSSHGLIQKRVDNVNFDIGVFTNLSRDHLDYHKNMQSYIKAKSLFFSNSKMNTAILNKDDSYFSYIKQACTSSIKIITFSMIDKKADISVTNIRQNKKGISCTIYSIWGQGEVKLNLFGFFNLKNVIVALACLCIKGFLFHKILKFIPQLKAPRGRMECLGGRDKPLVMIDYAHTDDAIDQVLSSLKEHGFNNIITIFGCGGDRDRGKRSLMLDAALKYSDHIVLTTDNPRYEDPNGIIDDILVNTKIMEDNISIQMDREQAILNTIKTSNKNNLVLIAGKGHESYQDIRGKRFPFDDKKYAIKALSCWKNND